MFEFDYTDTNFEQLVHAMAVALTVPVHNNQLLFPEAIGTGSFRHLHVPNGLHAYIMDCTLHQDWQVHINKTTTEEYYTLRFDELTIPQSLTISVGEEKIREKNTNKALAYLTSSLYKWSYEGTAGCTYKGVNIVFSKQWLAQYFQVDRVEEVLSSYISLKAESINIVPLDARYRRWMKTICHVEEDNPLRLTILQNRMMLLIERFFASLFEKMSNPAYRLPLTHDDIARVMHIERLLTRNVLQTPPSIQQLAKIAAVSESKLKKDFKTMYSFPIYEYFQKARMHAAQDKLLTGKYSVKEVAMELGYSNLSNFTIAFKKEFGMLPSQLLSQKKTI
ncbi:MAG TPA: AraC family transcriptional regulator [Niastella sp.]